MVNRLHLYSTHQEHLRVQCLAQDTSTHGQEEPGIEPPTLGLMDDPLYLLKDKLTELECSWPVSGYTPHLYITGSRSKLSAHKY